MAAHVVVGTVRELIGARRVALRAYVRKSTLIKILQGLYRPTVGKVRVDGTNIDWLEADSWHRSTAAHFQDFAHFDFTVGESIGIGDVDSLDDPVAVRAAAKRAGAQSLIDRIGGPRTVIGTAFSRGRELSGGQWQAVELARALMKDRPLVLTLDEPGHSLDPEAEVAMVAAYEAAARDYADRSGAIAFDLTHRLSSVRTADLVLVLRDGTIEAVGHHDELVASPGYYRDLFTLQAAAYTTDTDD